MDAALSMPEAADSPIFTLSSTFACDVTDAFLPSVEKAVLMRPSTFHALAASAVGSARGNENQQSERVPGFAP